jgi:hypothetical protein
MTVPNDADEPEEPDDNEPEEDVWQLAPRDEFAALTLADVLARRGSLPSQIEGEDTIAIGIRVQPVGLRVNAGASRGGELH